MPLQNHGVKTMSIGYLLRERTAEKRDQGVRGYSGLLIPAPNPNNDSPVVWRGMMVMKAVQQVRDAYLLVQRDGAETSSSSTWTGPPTAKILMFWSLTCHQGRAMCSSAWASSSWLTVSPSNVLLLTCRRRHRIDTSGCCAHRRSEGRRHVQQSQHPSELHMIPLRPV